MTEDRGELNPYQAPHELSAAPAARQDHGSSRFLTRLFWIGTTMFFSGFVLALVLAGVDSPWYVAAPTGVSMLIGFIVVMAVCFARIVEAITRWLS